MKKKLMICFSMVLMVIFALTGCGANYGEAVYECNSDNIWGFEGAYLDSENTFTIKFNPRHKSSEDFDIGFGNIFKSGEFGEFDHIVLMDENFKSYVPEVDDITIDSKNGTFSFEVEDFDISDLKRIHIINGNTYFDLDIVTDTLHASIYDDDHYPAALYIQSYDKDKKKWNEPEVEKF